MYNMCQIKKKAQIFKNVLQTVCHEVYTLSLNAKS